MAQPILRQLKIRSEEQQTLNKSYNKSTVIIPADAMYSTDLSQSYLNLKLKIITNAGKELTSDDLKTLNQHNLSVSFGHGSLDYSPASLIKHCVLKRGDGSVIESIPFSNILSQSLYQFTNNRESVSNKSLLSGMSIESNAMTGSLSSIVKSPIQVQIPLQDLFQSCKSSNWFMSETKGLIVELEFEDRKNIMKLNKIHSIITKKNDISDPTQNLLNLKPTIEFNDLLNFEDNYYKTVGTSVDLQETSLKLYANEYFKQPNLQLLSGSGIDDNLPLNRTLVFNDANKNISLETAQSKGLKVGDYVKMNFKYKSEKIAKNFQFYNKIVQFNDATPDTPEVPPVLEYKNIGGGVGGTVPELWTTDASTYLKNGAVATDIKTDVKIDASTGAYSLENTVWAAPPGDNSKDTAQYIIPKEVLGAGNTVNLTITVSSYQANPPTFTVTGSAQPVPAPTPAVAGDNAEIILENSLFSDEPTKYELVYIELVNGNLFTTYDKTANDFSANIKNNKLIVSETEITYLKEKGLINDDYTITNSCFDLIVQNEYVEAAKVKDIIASGLISKLSPELIENNKTYSNGAFILPNTGRKVKLNKLVQLAGSLYELEFSNLNVAETFGFQFKGVDRTSNSVKWTVSGLEAPKVKIGFVNFQKTQVALTNAELVAKIAEGLTYSIDLLEVVVHQQTKNKKMPMAKVYSTYSIEPFTIEDKVYQYAKQFNVSNPNTYNIALLMPLDNESLVSTAVNRNVFNYRFQINNISNTQTDLQLKTLASDYPTSLHLDKLIDYFGNSTYPIKTMFGIKGLENVSVVPSILPLKIYSADDGNSYYTNPEGFTVQLNMSSEETAGYIKPGVCYLIKSCLKSL